MWGMEIGKRLTEKCMRDTDADLRKDTRFISEWHLRYLYCKLSEGKHKNNISYMEYMEYMEYPPLLLRLEPLKLSKRGKQYTCPPNPQTSVEYWRIG